MTIERRNPEELFDQAVAAVRERAVPIRRSSPPRTTAWRGGWRRSSTPGAETRSAPTPGSESGGGGPESVMAGEPDHRIRGCDGFHPVDPGLPRPRAHRAAPHLVRRGPHSRVRAVPARAGRCAARRHWRGSLPHRLADAATAIGRVPLRDRRRRRRRDGDRCGAPLQPPRPHRTGRFGPRARDRGRAGATRRRRGARDRSGSRARARPDRAHRQRLERGVRARRRQPDRARGALATDAAPALRRRRARPRARRADRRSGRAQRAVTSTCAPTTVRCPWSAPSSRFSTACAARASRCSTARCASITAPSARCCAPAIRWRPPRSSGAWRSPPRWPGAATPPSIASASRRWRRSVARSTPLSPPAAALRPLCSIALRRAPPSGSACRTSPTSCPRRGP